MIDVMQSRWSEPPVRPTIPGVLGFAFTLRSSFGPPALSGSAHHVDTAPLTAPLTAPFPAPREPAGLGARRADHGRRRVRRGRRRARLPVRAAPPQHQRPRQPVRALPRPSVGPAARARRGRTAAELAVRIRDQLPARLRDLPDQPLRSAGGPLPPPGHRPRGVRGRRAQDDGRGGRDGLAAAHPAARPVVGGGAARGLVRAVRLVGDRGLVQPDVAGRADRLPAPVSDG